MLKALVGAVVAALTFGTAPAVPAHAVVQPQEDQVTVTGEGQAQVTPDTMVVRAGVEVWRADAAAAYQAIAAAATRLIEAVTGAGVAERDVRTAELSVQPEYTTAPRPEISGYRGTERLTVTVRELADAQTVLKAIMSAREALLYGVSFEKADLSAEYATAEKLAFADARTRALRQARLAQRRLGRAISISTQRTDPQPIRILGKEALMAGHLTPGEGTLQVTVNIVYALT